MNVIPRSNETSDSRSTGNRKQNPSGGSRKLRHCAPTRTRIRTPTTCTCAHTQCTSPGTTPRPREGAAPLGRLRGTLPAGPGSRLGAPN
eukprot:gene8401-biopygen3128